MSNRCPVCKTRLWQGPFFRRLKCPRCGAEFRPTVSWAYFQVLALLFIILGLSLVIIVSRPAIWPILVFLFLVALFFWFLPKLINLERTGPLTLAEGPTEADQIKLGLNYSKWEESGDDRDEPSFGSLYHLCILLALVVVSLMILFLFR